MGCGCNRYILEKYLQLIFVWYMVYLSERDVVGHRDSRGDVAPDISSDYFILTSMDMS
jgi:hypothetical protein